jgi:hypothetical protein
MCIAVSSAAAPTACDWRFHADATLVMHRAAQDRDHQLEGPGRHCGRAGFWSGWRRSSHSAKRAVRALKLFTAAEGLCSVCDSDTVLSMHSGIQPAPFAGSWLLVCSSTLCTSSFRHPWTTVHTSRSTDTLVTCRDTHSSSCWSDQFNAVCLPPGNRSTSAFGV